MIAEAATCLRAGGLVIFPTETVYGIAARADLAQALTRLRRLKGARGEKPFTWHVADLEAARRLPVEWSPAAWALAQRFWPGPLTLIVPHREGPAPSWCGAGGTVGIRVPRHAAAQALLAAAGGPIVAPSANRSGQPAPTTAAAVEPAVAAAVDYVLDAGPTALGESSTVVDGTASPPRILRAGATAHAIEAVLA